MNIAAMQRQVNEWKAQLNMQEKKHIFTLPNGDRVLYTSQGERMYHRSPTAVAFEEDQSFIKAVMGPYGSGKSTMIQQYIVDHARSMPYWYRGRRKARWIIIRNTQAELESTTLQTWLAWFDELGTIHKRKKPIMVYEHQFNDGAGIIELDLIFIALDRPDQVKKLKSLEATAAYINELSEVPQNVLSHLKGRVNHRYPSPNFCASNYWSGIVADTNPPSDDHWIKKDFEDARNESYKLFKQPPGLIKSVTGKWLRNTGAENIQYLAEDYYTKLAEGQDEDFVKVYCLGQYGIVSTGKRVYHEYNPDFHSTEFIKALDTMPIYLGWDFGLTPACVVIQPAPNGQIRILKEFIGIDIGIRSFATHVVLPGIKSLFPGLKIAASYADPSGIASDQIMEDLSCIGELNNIGIITSPAITNDIEPRIQGVKYFLGVMIDGQPGLLLSREGCPVLHKGFAKDYQYKRLAIAGEARFRDVPDKNGASHPHDALQYVILDHASVRVGRNTMEDMVKHQRSPVMNIF